MKVGDRAPDFSIADDHGRIRTLGDFAGRNIVLFFFPKADTPG